jgi:hypothetical protein
MVPVSVEGITSSWLGRALSARYPGTDVASVALDRITHGTATRLRLTVDYRSNEAGLPPTMWLKAGFEPHAGYLIGLGIYELEVRFYTELQPQLPVTTPRCYDAATDPATGQFVLLLEDLESAGVVWGRATSPVPVDTVRATLAAMARFHAHWWDDPILDEVAWIRAPDAGPVVEHYRRNRNPASVARALERPRAFAMPVALHDPVRIVNAFWALQSVTARRPRCLLHGDAHLGNVYYLPDGTPGFLDWQAVRKGRWSHDVNHFVVSALDIPDRRRWERELLVGYLDELRRHGVDPPSLEEAWLEYRQQVAYGLQGWTCTDYYQSEHVNTANLARFGAAAVDLDTFASLE